MRRGPRAGVVVREGRASGGHHGRQMLDDVTPATPQVSSELGPAPRAFHEFSVWGSGHAAPGNPAAGGGAKRVNQARTCRAPHARTPAGQTSAECPPPP